MKFSLQKIIIFILITLCFSVIIFIVDVFMSQPESKEEDFVEVSIYPEQGLNEKIDYIEIAEDILDKKEFEEKEIAEKEKIQKEKINKKLQELKERKEKKKLQDDEKNLSSAPELILGYIPKSFFENQTQITSSISQLSKEETLERFIEKLTVLFYKKRDDIRGRMKNKTIKLYAPQDMSDEELISVFIHEFAHYIDIYYFKREDGEDISSSFYDISWYSTVVLNPGMQGKDFVSGYAMTNKYEDFAETLTYYVFHNDDLLEKTKKSSILLEKYNFIATEIFGNGRFKNTDFSNNNIVKDYYRDITKIPFSRKNFLQYLENSI